MAEVSEDTEVKVAVEAAEAFVNNYYSVWNKPQGGKELAAFYVKSDPASALKPDIVMNGNIIADMYELESVFDNQPTKTFFDAQSFDCHVLNTNYNVGAPEKLLEGNKAGKKMSILVMVSGSVKYDDEEARGFTDNVVLVPNWEITAKNQKEKRKWLVQSQTFRLVL